MKAIRRWPCAIRCATARSAPPRLSLSTLSASIDARRAVDEDERDAGGDVALQIGVVLAVGDDDQAVDAAVEHAPRSSSRSRSGSSSELPAKVTTERVRATSSTPRWMAEKNGFETSSKISPIEADRPLARRSVPAVWLCR